MLLHVIDIGLAVAVHVSGTEELDGSFDQTSKIEDQEHEAEQQHESG